MKVNYEKTEALWIGSYKDRAFSIPYSKPVTLAEGKVYALGVQFSTSEINENNINFCEKIEKIKMRKFLSSWSAKKLTLLGKIAVLNPSLYHKLFMSYHLYQHPKVLSRRLTPYPMSSFGTIKVTKSREQK